MNIYAGHVAAGCCSSTDFLKWDPEISLHGCHFILAAALNFAFPLSVATLTCYLFATAWVVLEIKKRLL